MGIREQIDVAFERWGHVVYRWRWLVIVGMILVTGVLGSGMASLRFENSTDTYLDRNDPARVTYDAFRAQFANDDSLLLVLHGDPVFSFEFLDKLRRFHRELEEKIPLLDEIQSLINARVTRASSQDLIVEELFERWPANAAELAAIEKRARSNPVYTNTLLSEDARYTTVTLRLLPGTSESASEALQGFGSDPSGAVRVARDRQDLAPILEDEELASVMHSLAAVVKRYRSPDFPIWVTGNPEMSYELTVAARRDMTLFAGLTNLVIGLLLLILFRRISGVALPILVVTLPLAATLGIMGFSGLPLTPSTQQLPSLLLAVCVGDSVHLLVTFFSDFDRGLAKEAAIARALRRSGLALVMTSLTTAGGLGSFLVADLAPVRGLGVAAPTGVMLALIYSTVLLPALVAVLPLRRRKRFARGTPGLEGNAPNRVDRILVAMGDLAANHPWKVILLWSILGAGAIYGATQLRIAHKPLDWFPEDYPTRVAAEVANREMKGLMPLEILVDSGRENGLYDPDLLQRIERLQQFARSIDVDGMVAGQALSVVDILKETHQALHGDDPGKYRIPERRDLIAQELLLFENSGSDDMEDLVDTPLRTARVSLLVSYDDGFRYLEFVRQIDQGAQRIFGSHATIETTGLVKLWVRTISAMLSSTVKSYLIALLVISPMMIFLVGEVRLGLLSLIPNLTPIAMGMGLMYGLGIPFDMFTMMIGSITIGMAVDDTIHFMHGFRQHYRISGDSHEAITETLRTTGRALVITSLALSTGFFVQMFGTMISVRHSGFITGFTILAALLADLNLSPALVTLAMRFDDRKRARRVVRDGDPTRPWDMGVR